MTRKATCSAYTRRGPRSIWSLRNVGHIARLEAAGRLHPSGRDAVESAKSDGRWDAAYAGPATAEVPQDLLDAIAANASAQAMFDVLSSQNRFALAYRLGQLKTEAARERGTLPASWTCSAAVRPSIRRTRMPE